MLGFSPYSTTSMRLQTGSMAQALHHIPATMHWHRIAANLNGIASPLFIIEWL
jgi:hypothetical protein